MVFLFRIRALIIMLLMLSAVSFNKNQTLFAAQNGAYESDSDPDMDMDAEPISDDEDEEEETLENVSHPMQRQQIKLDLESFQRIVSFLTARDLANLARTNRRINHLLTPALVRLFRRRDIMQSLLGFLAPGNIRSLANTSRHFR